MYEIEIVRGLRFIVHDQEAKEWYDPIKPYTALEYEWVLDNIDLTGKILECGGHHGHYAVVLASKGGEFTVIDPHPANCTKIGANIELNNQKALVLNCAVANHTGTSYFNGKSNGRLIPFGEMEVNTRTLQDLMPDADVIKLDIEGGEYAILPGALDSMIKTKTWIIELHPQFGNPREICNAFLKQGYTALSVDRQQMKVREYDNLDSWEGHKTCIFQK